MSTIKKLLTNAIDTTFKTVIKKDYEYLRIENEKKEIVKKLKNSLSEYDFSLIEKLLDCCDGQNYITAMGFSLIRVLDIKKHMNS